MGADASKSAVLTLRQYSLVEDFAGEGRRLTMHQTIHDYAASEAAGEPDAYRRMAEYFLVFISAEQDSTGDTEKWLLALEQEKDNIAALLEMGHWARRNTDSLPAHGCPVGLLVPAKPIRESQGTGRPDSGAQAGR
jgi:hypothetical protein